MATSVRQIIVSVASMIVEARINLYAASAVYCGSFVSQIATLYSAQLINYNFPQVLNRRHISSNRKYFQRLSKKLEFK